MPPPIPCPSKEKVITYTYITYNTKINLNKQSSRSTTHQSSKPWVQCYSTHQENPVAKQGKGNYNLYMYTYITFPVSYLYMYTYNWKYKVKPTRLNMSCGVERDAGRTAQVSLYTFVCDNKTTIRKMSTCCCEARTSLHTHTHTYTHTHTQTRTHLIEAKSC